MDSKILHDIINKHAAIFQELGEEVAKKVMKPLSEVDIEDNEDLRIVHARLKEMFIAKFTFECGMILFHNMKADTKSY